MDQRGSMGIEGIFGITSMFGIAATVLMLLLWAYAQGVVHAAADQGARAGSRIDVDSGPTCQAKASSTLSDALPGIGPDASVTCEESEGVVTISIRLHITGGIPPFRSTTLTASASSRKEAAPE